MSKERGMKCYLVILKGSAEDVFCIGCFPLKKL